MFSLKTYAPADAKAWDAVVRSSRNGNLLHRRSYMDYHADRFVDRSLLIERDNRLIAVLPASLQGKTVSSHGGLTYGGLIVTEALQAEAALTVFQMIGAHYRAQGVERLIYKAIPHVFHRYPAEEDLFALHWLGARLVRRDISSVIAMSNPLGYTTMRKRSIKRAGRHHMAMRTVSNVAAFHNLLSDVLRRHDAAPTHSMQELQLLRGRFPNEIVLYQAHHDEDLLAGVVAYDFGHIVHMQYMAASQHGRELGALDLLLDTLITTTYASKHYFSFGISTEREGRFLNGSLIAQKEHFGARGVVHDFYEWSL
ncbi:GNAT family N-acetyltransferase [Dyella sp. 2HG41-7]|uniref:GNAT family N-acetyltransferase n=1 Tax=Dyella sp. 2HG41-7 TaxID=2883239 RepID=UPI001F438A8E|nr:GNAT family N-acetyltransferase [Dyella sp. 2HG41-7]